MKVTSGDIASAAVEFWRQGLAETDVNARLKSTTIYARIAGLEFDEAAKLVTSATNSMNLDVERVVDVFTYLGDASAAGADEVGRSMQKASAAAQEAGLSFEWLGSYIATVSERTRLAPEVIGSSFNSILSRLHSIKQTGYNEEDETRLNDIAKALDTINVRLMDEYGAWIPLNEVFASIAEKWDTLTDTQRAYIATTIAGTRQQNIFLNLMSDMALGAEGGSRAFELYAGAMESAGQAAQKYAIYQKSAQAAQDAATAGWERLYALFSDDLIVGFYNQVAVITNAIADMFESPLPAAQELANQLEDISSKRMGVQDEYRQIKPLIDEYIALANVIEPTADEQERMQAILVALRDMSPGVALAILNMSGEFKNQAEVVASLTGYLQKLNTTYAQLSFQEGYTQLQLQAKGFQESYEQLND